MEKDDLRKQGLSPVLSRTFIISIIISILLSLLIRLLNPLLAGVPHLPDAGASWYYWKLPEAKLVSRLTAWIGYGLHQLTIWIIIFYGKKNREKGSSFRLNFILLGVNLFFILLHLLQTHLFYDGLAQDVSVWSSQYSVIGMLIIVLVMMIPRRGLFFGKKFKLPEGVYAVFKRFHGYYIAWALVYTFWFHPMDGDWRLVIGFLYMFFLFIQLSLFRTPLHSSSPWIVFLEFFVTVHGTVVAILSGQSAWTMFLFGFLFMFVFTQIYGLKLPAWMKGGALILYFAGAGVAYYFRGFGKLYELSFIPVTLYLGAILSGLLVWGGVALVRTIKKAGH